MIKSITATGIIYGNETVFECLPNRDGQYELARRVGRVPGSRPQDKVNKVSVDSIEQAWDMLRTEKYYIVLTGHIFGIHRKSLRSFDSVQVVFDRRELA